MGLANQNIGFDKKSLKYVGDTIRPEFTITDESGELKDLTGATIIYIVSRTFPVDDPAATPLYTKTLADDVVIVALGKARAVLTSAETIAMGAGDFYHQMVVVDAATDTALVAEGTIRLKPRI